MYKWGHLQMGSRQAPLNGLGGAPLLAWSSQMVGLAMACVSSYCSGTSAQQLITRIFVVVPKDVRLQQTCSSEMDTF